MASQAYLVEQLPNEVQRITAMASLPSAVCIDRYTDATRPSSAEFPVGWAIWNLSDAAQNFADGAVWRDSAGNIT